MVKAFLGEDSKRERWERILSGGSTKDPCWNPKEALEENSKAMVPFLGSWLNSWRVGLQGKIALQFPCMFPYPCPFLERQRIQFPKQEQPRVPKMNSVHSY